MSGSLDGASLLLVLYSRYSFAVDSLDAEEIAKCFTEDAVFGVTSKQMTAGRDRIVARLTGSADPAVVHHAFNVVALDHTAEIVLVRADFTMMRHGQTIATGNYLDEIDVSKDDPAFRRRTITYTWRADG